MLPAQLQLVPQPEAPSTDSQIEFVATLLDENAVHTDSLSGEAFTLELVRDGRDQSPRQVGLRSGDAGSLLVTSQDGGDTIGRLAAGRWTARLSRLVEDPQTGETDRLVFGSVSFLVTEPTPTPHASPHAYAGSDAHTCTDSHADAHADSQPNADRHAESHPDRNLHSDPDIHAHVNPYADAHAYPYTDPDASPGVRGRIPQVRQLRARGRPAGRLSVGLHLGQPPALPRPQHPDGRAG